MIATVGLIKFLDRYLGSCICFCLSVFFRKSDGKKEIIKYQKIACIQLWGIGETILSLPAIKALGEKLPHAKITIITTKRVESVFFGQKVIDRIETISLNPFSILFFIIKNRKKYDLVIDMEEYLTVSAIMAFFLGKSRIGYAHGIRSRVYTRTVKYDDQQHVVQTFLDLLKPLDILKKAQRLSPLHYSKEALQTAKKIIGRVKKPIIAISAGAAESGRIRMWPNEKWAALIDFVNEKYQGTVFLVGARDTVETNEDILRKVRNKETTFNIAGITNVSELFALATLFDLMISIDSGPMHVAAAQNVPTIGLFGPNTPVRFGPFGKKNIAIYKPVAPPAINVHKGEVPNSSGLDYMENIQVNDVMEAVNRLLK